MKKTLLLIFTSFLLFSCQQEISKENESVIANKESTIFAINGEDFNAKLKSVDPGLSGWTKGNTLWQRTGSLSYVLSELYGHPVVMNSNPYSKHNYKLSINWSNETSLKKIRNIITTKMKNTFKYTVASEIQIEPKYVLAVAKASILEKTNGTDFANDGAVSKVSINGGKWKIYGSLNKLAYVLRLETGKTVVVEENASSKSYYFELTASADFDEIVKQLQNSYGLAVQEKKVPVEYYVIDFT